MKPITYAQAVRFKQTVEQLLEEFVTIGMSERTKIEFKFDTFAHAYRAAVARKSPPEVLEYLDEQYRKSFAVFDNYLREVQS